ncbi:MAG TPA: hypothetical protein VGO47_03250, partial [Chlamydiales bacterium]|nr:hypothetical protein [Chlamydiales bacterium]
LQGQCGTLVLYVVEQFPENYAFRCLLLDLVMIQVPDDCKHAPKRRANDACGSQTHRRIASATGWTLHPNSSRQSERTHNGGTSSGGVNKKMEAESAQAVATAKKAATDAWAAATTTNTFNTEGKGIHDRLFRILDEFASIRGESPLEPGTTGPVDKGKDVERLPINVTQPPSDDNIREEDIENATSEVPIGVRSSQVQEWTE